MRTVLIGVRRGLADVVACPPDVEVEIRDFDVIDDEYRPPEYTSEEIVEANNSHLNQSEPLKITAEDAQNEELHKKTLEILGRSVFTLDEYERAKEQAKKHL